MIKTLHTLGSIGAEYSFSKFAVKKGITTIFHSCAGIKPCSAYGIIENHNNKELEIYKDRLEEVTKHLGIADSKKHHAHHLLLQMLLVEKSDVILAVGLLENGWFTDTVLYCVTRALLDYKSVYFFDQKVKKWYAVNDDKTFTPEVPVLKYLPDNVAGIGIKDINIDGIEAVEKLFSALD